MEIKDLFLEKGAFQMWLGFLLVSLAGICWVGTGIVVSMSAKRGVNYNIVQLISGLILIDTLS